MDKLPEPDPELKQRQAGASNSKRDDWFFVVLVLGALVAVIYEIISAGL